MASRPESRTRKVIPTSRSASSCRSRRAARSTPWPAWSEPSSANSLKQPVIIENRPGAGGNLAADAVAKSAPDGHTILLTTNGHAISPSLYRTLPYDTIKDFIPVTQLIASSLVLVANPKVPAKSVPELIALAKSTPGGLTYGMTGVGTPLHLTMEMLKHATGIALTAVPYRGDAPLLTALVAGEVPMAITPLATTRPHVEAGTLRAVAVTGATRSPALPDVPTVAEQGVAGFASSSWQGFFVPAHTPREIVAVIQQATSKVLDLPEVRERLKLFGSEAGRIDPGGIRAPLPRRHRDVRADRARRAYSAAGLTALMGIAATHRARLRLAADIGGTFTDIAVFDDKTGKLTFGKALSTPHRLVEGISAGVEKAGSDYASAGLFLHGSTIAINTIIERTGARTALLITEGFRDIYEIGRINRPDAYNLFFQKHEPLVERALRFEVAERVLADGEIDVALTDADVAAADASSASAASRRPRSCSSTAMPTPTHEARAKAILEADDPGDVRLRVARAVAGVSRIRALLHGGRQRLYRPQGAPLHRRDRPHIRGAGFAGSFLIVQSTGGLYEADQARSHCIRMLESGPAAGVIGTQALCGTLGLKNAIAFDMGGTTAKAGVIHDGEALTTGAALIGGYEKALPVQIAMMDIFEVGTGGGSIARIDEGALRVGPASAGAAPGPACYGLGGTEPTVTDANLVLGRLGADRFLGGEMRLDRAAAERALRTRIADPLGMDVTTAADGILRDRRDRHVVRGEGRHHRARPRRGGVHARRLWGCRAAACGRRGARDRHQDRDRPGRARRVLGLRHAVRGPALRFRPHLVHAPGGCAFDAIERVYGELEQQGRQAVAATTVKPQRITVKRAADMRYVGQEHAVTVDLPMPVFMRRDRVAIKRHFDAMHALRYGTSAPDEPAEIVSLRSTVTGLMRKPPQAKIAKGQKAPPREAFTGKRKVWLGERGFGDTPTWRRATLLAGNRIAGPALIEEHASTTVLLRGDVLDVDALGNLVITVAKGR